MKKERLELKYVLSRTDGTPIDPNDKFFILRLKDLSDKKYENPDDRDWDRLKQSFTKKALLNYAQNMRDIGEEDFYKELVDYYELEEVNPLFSNNFLHEVSIEEFHNTGLLTFVNIFLQIFGYTIALITTTMECGLNKGKVSYIKMIPTRTLYRGFDTKNLTESFLKLTLFMANESPSLMSDMNSSDNGFSKKEWESRLKSLTTINEQMADNAANRS